MRRVGEGEQEKLLSKRGRQTKRADGEKEGRKPKWLGTGKGSLAPGLEKLQVHYQKRPVKPKGC